MADLSRDIRWGRMVEGFGEDPYLGSVMTAARVEGFHAGGLTTAAKHFAGYGAPWADATTTRPTSPPPNCATFICRRSGPRSAPER